MVTQYKITSAITDGTQLTVIAKCCEQIGTRKDEYGNTIPIIKCRIPGTGKLTYIKNELETAYEALPDETLVKLLIGKTWVN